MSQVSTTTTTPPVTFMVADALTTTMTLVIVSTSLEVPGMLGLDSELPPPPEIPPETMRGVAAFAAVLQQQTLPPMDLQTACYR